MTLFPLGTRGPCPYSEIRWCLVRLGLEDGGYDFLPMGSLQLGVLTASQRLIIIEFSYITYTSILGHTAHQDD